MSSVCLDKPSTEPATEPLLHSNTQTICLICILMLSSQLYESLLSDLFRWGSSISTFLSVFCVQNYLQNAGFKTYFAPTLICHIRTIKPTRCTDFSNLFLEINSTCFGQFLCPSSGVFHCTHSNGYMSYRFCWLLVTGIRMFYPDPSSKMSA
jgi:hypothetical protein